MMKQKVKVIELVGQKLDPKATYIFVVDERAMPMSDIRNMANQLYDLIGEKFVIGVSKVEPEKAMKVFEIAPSEKVAE